MAQSILNSIKKVLGVAESDTSFDTDIILHTNSIFSVLTQVGIGPATGFMIEDATTTWDAFLMDDDRLNMAKSLVYLRVRLLFDPPTTGFVITSMEKNIAELEWRLNVQREEESWVDPFPVESIVA